MKKYIVAAALAVVLSAAVFTSAWALTLCTNKAGVVVKCSLGSIPMDAARVDNPADAPFQASINPGILHARAKAISDYFTTRQIRVDLDWQQLGLKDQNDFLALARDAEQFFSMRQRVLTGYKLGATMPNFDTIYGQLGFATPDAAWRWYGGYTNYILGLESSFPGNERGDLIFYPRTVRDEIIKRSLQQSGDVPFSATVTCNYGYAYSNEKKKCVPNPRLPDAANISPR
ncbi:MAG: hypothetical protein K8R48_05730 [Alphaproteobacteria bacterium]|nr:hypothetical protein [Alphaproteobacteria bacterium]